ncbi:MAG TPA: response regulator [Geminicoccaceae bacterium]|nr:response regulator [Geminicoccaceae bacterium]
MADGQMPIQGLRILVAEDNVLAAMEVEQILREHGCEPIGPAPTVEYALHLVRAEPLDGAILDINLRDQLIFPVAAELERRGIPFIFATGYEDGSALPADLKDRPRLRKPFSERQLVQLLTSVIAKR